MGHVALGVSARSMGGETSTNQQPIPEARDSERASRIGSPDGADTRAQPRRLNLHQRDRPAFASRGISSARMRPRRNASSHKAGRTQSSPAVAE